MSARSLLLAVRAALHDDHHPDAAGPGLPDVGRAGELRPANSHQPWTEVLDTQLRDTWLACGTADPAPVIEEIAEVMGRSTAGIRARLLRVGCNPELPGAPLTAAEVAAAEDPEPSAPHDTAAVSTPNDDAV